MPPKNKTKYKCVLEAIVPLMFLQFVFVVTVIKKNISGELVHPDNFLHLLHHLHNIT